MADIIEIDWVKFDEIKGSLVFTNEGLFFQPYKLQKNTPYLLGDSLSINQSGIFGAANIHRKLMKDNYSSAPEIARAERQEKGFKKLLDEGLAIFIHWNDILRVRNRRLLGIVELTLNDGKKMIFRDPDDRKAVLDVVTNRSK